MATPRCNRACGPAVLLRSTAVTAALVALVLWQQGVRQRAVRKVVRSVSSGPQYVAGVPIYNSYPTTGHDGRDVGKRRLRNSTAAMDWILALRANVSSDQLQRLCRHQVQVPADSFAQGNLQGLTTLEVSPTCLPPTDGASSFAILRATRQQLEQILRLHRDLVEFAEMDGPVSLVPVNRSQDQQRSPSLQVYGHHSEATPWGLDRIDQRFLPLDGRYLPAETGDGGSGVHIYLADTGIRSTHQDFHGRAIPTLEVLGEGVRECAGSDDCAWDGNGHGTHTAGIAGGSVYGVAPNATLHALKVLDDSGVGQWSWLVAALIWVTANGERPAVFSASLGSNAASPAVERAIARATSSGVTVVVAAGNENADACHFYPSSLSTVVTVGATTRHDDRAEYSNWGPCVDIFAPGSHILSAFNASDSSSAVLSGTSMACPHVAGAAALLLHRDPTMLPQQVAAKLQARATEGIVVGFSGSTANNAEDEGAQDLLLYDGAQDSRPPPPRRTTTSTRRSPKVPRSPGSRRRNHQQTRTGPQEPSSEPSREPSREPCGEVEREPDFQGAAGWEEEVSAGLPAVGRQGGDTVASVGLGAH